VAGIPLQVRRSFWSRYYADIQTFMRPEAFTPKQATVARILEQCRPETVVDIGCNRGGYAILAARAGARVTAFDTDEDSVALLYELAKEQRLDILPLVMDFLSPSPACGWRGLQFPSALQRLRSEMALALALVHHLAITQRQTFERIAPAWPIMPTSGC
jgi:SAM-dependent methyltransferase